MSATAGPAAGPTVGAIGGVATPDVLDAVREQLARTGAPLTPDVVARALRDQGRPVGDATVLAVHDLLRQDILGAGPLEPLLRLPASPTCSSTAPTPSTSTAARGWS